MSNVVIIGAGASGLMMAALASERGCSVTVVEKNEKAGKKLYITGKGRCNLTNAGDRDSIMESIVTNGRFLYSSFNSFGNYDVMDFFESRGVKLKVERGMRVFPESDKASDIIRCLEKTCAKFNVKFIYGVRATEILTEQIENEKRDSGAAVKRKAPERRAVGVKLDNGGIIPCDCLAVATGGLSYPSTGSTGDGYGLARALGHKVTKCFPSLVSVRIEEPFCAEMAGLTLKNVRVEVSRNGQELYTGFGEMLFTHTGVSGPLILSCTAKAGIACEGALLKLDLKPAVDGGELESRLLREIKEDPNKQLKSVIRRMLPAAMVPAFLYKAAIDGTKKAVFVTKEERQRIIQVLKGFDMHITGLGGYNEAVVTKGGIEVKEINPATMESRLCEGVFFIGEVLDLDALTGGYNLQIAWSTAAAAAMAVSAR